MEEKKCSKCGLVKNLHKDYYKHKQSKGGYDTQCKLCVIEVSNNRYKSLTLEDIDKRKQYSINYRKINPEYGKNYYYDNIENFIEYRGNKKEYFQNKNKIRNITKKDDIRLYNLYYKELNPNYWKEWSSKRRKEDPLFRLQGSIRSGIYSSFINMFLKKSKRTEEILGCSFEEFKYHIESQFQPWMNWDNHGDPKDGILEFNKTWDLDHIIPISSAKIEEDIYKLNHFSNFQPLCSKYNREIKRNY